uniref:Uncharacterized protein n=1 Tax=Onchocerca volvulus TaxID=6282 RepID=A0A8R1TVK9_ONCVO
MTDNTSQGSVMVMEEFQIRNFMYGRPDPVVVAKPELNGYLGRTSRVFLTRNTAEFPRPIERNRPDT